MINTSDYEYILYACPEGDFRKPFTRYWDEVKANKDLNHLFVRQYPPHVSLTSFFTKKDIKKNVELEQALESAIAKTKKVHDTAITDLKQSPAFDRIELKSQFFLDVTQQFAELIHLPKKKAKKGIDEPLHITLKQKRFKMTWKNSKIQELEKKLMKEIKGSKPEWSLRLYMAEARANDVKKLTRLKTFKL